MKTKLDFKAIQNALLHLGCLNRQEITDLFGSDHYAFKLFSEYEGNVARFIGSLDLGNLNRLTQYFHERETK